MTVNGAFADWNVNPNLLPHRFTAYTTEVPFKMLTTQATPITACNNCTNIVTFQYNTTDSISNKQNLPQFIIIGVMKCGTSATSTFLRQHSLLVDMGIGFNSTII